jgi:hypothetical protein
MYLTCNTQNAYNAKPSNHLPWGNKKFYLEDFITNVSQNLIATSSCSLHKHLTFKISNLKRVLIFISNCIYILIFINIIHSLISMQCKHFLHYYSNIFAIRSILSSAAGFMPHENWLNPHSLCVFRVLSVHSGKL